MNRGFSLVELVVGAALLAIVSLSVYQAYSSVIKLSRGSGDKVTATLLANEQIEILHNLPYQSVGEIGGIPAGLVTHATTTTRNGNTFTITTTIRNVDDPYDGLFPADTSPADYKLANVDVVCTTCTQTVDVSLTTNIAPKTLETVTNNGALYISVIDALGQPVKDAVVNITNAAQGLNFTDTTDASGLLKVFDVLPASLAYSVLVTKSGYSSDQTYAITSLNPAPTKQALTVAAGAPTDSSFSIDTLASLALSSKDSSCNSAGSYSFTMQGNKTIGTNGSSSVYKYSSPLSTSGGSLTINPLEWDYYSIISNDSAYDLAGILPVGPIHVTPGSAAAATLVVAPHNPASLMAVVKDQATKLPVSGATVTWTPAGGTTRTLTTGVGSLMQSNWIGGAGQVNFTDQTRFYDSDGNIAISTPNQLTLVPQGSVYASSGALISSTFDLQTDGSLYKITWTPQGQAAGAGTDPVKFQIASNNDNATWNYIGPDGTSGSYYTITNTTVGNEQANHRYFRYKLFLSTALNTVSPSVSNITFQFTTACTPSAEVLFQGLTLGSTGTLTASSTGYGLLSQPNVSISKNWQEYDVYLTHQ